MSGNSDKVKIVNTEGFAKDTGETKGIKSLYMPEAATESEPKDVKEDCYIKETLQVQNVVWKLNGDKVPKLEFFYSAIDE